MTCLKIGLMDDNIKKKKVFDNHTLQLQNTARQGIKRFINDISPLCEVSYP